MHAEGNTPNPMTATIPSFSLRPGAAAGQLESLINQVSWLALTQDAGCMVSVIDRDGRFQYANDVVARFIGREIHEMVGRTLAEVLPEDFAEERLGIVRRVISTGEPVTLVTRLMGGRMDCVYRPLRDGAGMITHVLAIGRSNTTIDGVPPGSVVELSNESAAKLDTLTSREREVLQLIGEGMSTAQIADRLFRTVKTVEAHRASLGRKLGVNNRVQLAHIAIQAGLVSNPSAENQLGPRLRRNAGDGLAPGGTNGPGLEGK